MHGNQLYRRSFLRHMLYGPAALFSLDAFAARRSDAAPIDPKDAIKVTNIETFVLKNSWVFVKISTDAGITGWGEMLKDDAKACAAGALEVKDYLLGKDPRPVVHHWQAIQASRGSDAEEGFRLRRTGSSNGRKGHEGATQGIAASVQIRGRRGIR